MHLTQRTKVSTILASSWLISSCGIIIGNPGNPAESGDSANFVQTIDYDIPASVSGYSLVSDAPDGIFDDSARRIDETIDRVNRMITQLNQDAIRATGDFTGKGPDGKISGRIIALDDNADGYTYQAIICYAGSPFQTVEWSATTGSVHAVRNHAVDPIDARRRSDMLSEITYTKGTTTSIDVWLTATPPQTVPGADGRKLADHTRGTYAEGTYTLAGIHNWYDEVATVQDEGDEYFVGRFDEEGVGENVTYNVFRPDCSSTVFDDTAATHTWCGGRKIPGGTAFNASDRAAAAARLQDIALPGKASLKVPTLATDLACP
jgi:hypothetical protein